MCVASATAISAPHAYAQIDPPVLTPDRERIQPLTEAESDSVPTLLQSSANNAPANADKITLDFRGVVIEGEPTIVSERMITDRFSTLVGRTVTVEDLFIAAQDIENFYREQGYITSRVVVPAQKLDDGRFRIRVIEGFIDDVSVSGDIGPVSKAVERLAERLKEERPIAEAALQEFALLVSDLPGVEGQSILRPAARAGATGGSDLDYAAKRKKYDAFVAIDNRGSQVTGPWAIFAGASMNSMTRFAEQLSVTLYSTIDFNEQIVGQVSYSQLVGPPGMRAGASLSVGMTETGEPLEIFGFESDSLAGSFFVEYPFIRTVNFSLWGDVTASFTNATTYRGPLGIETEDRIQLFEDKTRKVSLGTRWRANFLRENDWSTTTSGNLRLSQGFDVLGATPDATPETLFERSRVDGEATFTKVNAEVAVTQETPGPLKLFARVGGQWASSPLLAVEEFQLGGTRFARGYEPAQETGDNAIGVTLEVQSSLKDQIDSLNVVGEALNAADAYVFLDAGKVWNDDDTGDGSLTSAGIGIRTRWMDHALVDLEAAFPLNEDVRFGRNSDVQFFMRVAFFR